MEVGFLVREITGTSSEAGVRWWYSCIAEEVERKGSITVRYLMQCVLPRPSTLECTQQALVSVCSEWSFLFYVVDVAKVRFNHGTSFSVSVHALNCDEVC